MLACCILFTARLHQSLWIHVSSLALYAIVISNNLELSCNVPDQHFSTAALIVSNLCGNFSFAYFQFAIFVVVAKTKANSPGVTCGPLIF